ncbi:N-6 DNA methylase [Microbulbifer rhizosphaerae]|uniref:site-specific DNA-methyltransferase (adenine-specific) n=1 Tax=Microbulbifer rhizosphaerae TaxID=1562603 RepID=A0A7W4W8L0_9GAMM|nr:N-6 DNA methylase [Microbulbifer rhizosphaerae]MBB3059720.1 type I restriction enzyme M protein [Microbulbifer rhizosphaerae]
MDKSFSSMAAFLWSVADLLRGDFKQSQYGRVILPFTLLRRLECVLAPTKGEVRAKYGEVKSLPEEAQEKLLLHAAKQPFYNTSEMDLRALGTTQILDNLESYVQAFSPAAREIFDYFSFSEFLEKLNDANLLYLVAEKFANIDLSPDAIGNHEMGLIFEDLIRRFAESSNETAGEHFTPRDIVRLTTSLVFAGDDDALARSGIVRSIYDPTAGTGGFLSSGMEYLHEVNQGARLATFGQELNPESYAICKADMLIKGQDVSNIKLGNTLSDDQLPLERFDYMLSNPPFGVEWKKVQKVINDEHKLKGYSGRFGPGLPRVSDGSLLFLLHLISKMRPKDAGGSRIGIILNGSPLFTGGAGSGESEIRRYILEQDLLEAIIALPTDMFYNTGIATYIWVLSNHKPAERKGKVQLVNATGSDYFAKMRKSLGSKRNTLTEEAIEAVVKSYGQFETGEDSKIFDYREFGYRRITVERPLKLALYPHDTEKLAALRADKGWAKLSEGEQSAILQALAAMPEEKYLSRNTFKKQLSAKLADTKLSAVQFKLLCKHLGEQDDDAEVCKTKGQPEPNPDLRDNENVPLSENIEDYFAREVLPHVPDAWIDTGKTDPQDAQVGIVGYEIPFNRHFYQYVPPRSLEAIDADLDKVTADILDLLQEVHSRQAVISHAVTKGLNPHAKMKDSGVEWLDEVPEHWVVTRLKHISRLQSGIAKGRTVSENAITVPMLRVANVQDGYVKLDDVHTIQIEPEELDRYSLKAGDLLMNEGGDNDKLGRGTVWQAKINPCIHQNHVFAVRVFGCEPEWVALFTQSSYAKFYFYSVSKQSTNLASIASSSIKEAPILLPPKHERAEIMAYLKQVQERLDALLEKSASQISLLQERRSALMSAAVTGKIDVRDWQPEQVEPEPKLACEAV